MGNGEAKELICMTHGPELKGQEMWIEGDCRMEGNKETKKNQQNILKIKNIKIKTGVSHCLSTEE